MRKFFLVLAAALICAAGVSPSDASAATNGPEAKYGGIIASYRDNVTHLDEEDAIDDFLAAISRELGFGPDTGDNDKAYELECSILELRYETRENLGYSYRDLNGDGIPELFILTSNFTISAIYSLIDGKPVLVGAYWSRNRCVIDKAGTLFINASSGADDSFSATYSFGDGGELQLIEMVGVESYDEKTGQTFPKPRWYRIQNGKKTIIDEKKAETAIKKIPDVYPDNPTKNAGLTFIPLY